MEKPRFFADLADSGLLGHLAWLNVALGDGPAILRVLNQQNLDIFLIMGQAKNDTACSWLTDDFLNNRLFSEDGFFELVDSGGFVLFR